MRGVVRRRTRRGGTRYGNYGIYSQLVSPHRPQPGIISALCPKGEVEAETHTLHPSKLPRIVRVWHTWPI